MSEEKKKRRRERRKKKEGRMDEGKEVLKVLCFPMGVERERNLMDGYLER